MASRHYDLAVVGAGIVGLAHALAASRLGLSVVVVDRDEQANGASVRNFGFITVTGQESGPVWRRARRSRDVWMEVAGPAGIAIEQQGMVMVAQRPEARQVAEAFLRTDMAAGCRWLDREETLTRLGKGGPRSCEGALLSDIEVRVESRTALPRLASWLASQRGVEFRWGVAVRSVRTGRLDTSMGVIRANSIVVCSGDDLVTLFPEQLAGAGIRRCQLQMLRLASPGYRLPAAVMSDLSLIRYLGYSALPAAGALRERLQREQSRHIEHGIHLIVTQSSDGSLVVGDSHHYAMTPEPFAAAEVEQLILEEFAAVLGEPPAVIARWTGTYASAPGHSIVRDPMEGVRLVVVTGGTGASTAFALAEEVLDGMNLDVGGVAA